MKYTYDEVLISVVKYTLLGLILFLLSACSPSGPFSIDLMPAPEVYDDTNYNPFTDLSKLEMLPYDGMLYATVRAPATDDDWQQRYYRHERGALLRFGLGRVDSAEKRFSWEEALLVSLHQNRPSLFPIFLTEVEEFGVLSSTVNGLVEPDIIPEDLEIGEKRMAGLLNAKLALSSEKDIHIYVHGYKVIFDDPLLVATELWHFLGYDGAFVAFSWPSTPRKMAYFADLETARYSSRHLRLLVEFLSENTEVERINIVGYSAGTRVVLDALAEISLRQTGDQVADQLRLGDVILAGSDYDRWVFGNMLEDGLLDVVDSLTVYGSSTDKALNFSRWVLGRDRLGQIVKDDGQSETLRKYIRDRPKLTFVDVTGVEKSTAGNGHAYFRQSPWVSSDLLMLLRYGLKPEERGLKQQEDLAAWHFPDDYIEQLRATLINKKLVEPIVEPEDSENNNLGQSSN